MISKQAAYSHRSQSNYQGTYNQGGTMVGPFMLPDNIKSLHSYSLVHLTKLGAEGIENNAFIKELISTESDDSPDFAAMLTKYPEHPGLLEMVLLYASSNRDRKEINPDLLRKLLASRKDLSPADRFRANSLPQPSLSQI
jgi:hypothetical protein